MSVENPTTCTLRLRTGDPCTNPVDESVPWAICSDCVRAVWMLKAQRYNDATQQVARAAAAEWEADHDRRVALRAAGDADTVVYYVAMPGDLVKIGTTRNLRSRLVALMAKPYDVLAAEPGSFGLERQRHAQFHDLRAADKTELFHRHPRLMAHIENVITEHGRPVLHRRRPGVEFVHDRDRI